MSLAYEVALAVPPYRTYTYSAPTNGQKIDLGYAVKVPLGNSRNLQSGWVWKIASPDNGMRLKPIAQVVGTEPVFNSELLTFLRWFSEYYISPPGIVCQTALPPGFDDQERSLRTEKWSRFTGRTTLENTTRLPRGTNELIADLIRSPDWEPLSERVTRTSATPAAITRLQHSNIIELEARQTWRDDSLLQGIPPSALEIPSLTTAQSQAITALCDLLLTSQFRSTLLYGVTGSGKTRVYLELVRATLNQKKSALIIVPEISMTPQLIGQFRAWFGERVHVLHSSLTASARRGAHLALRGDDQFVVIGARSVLFAPLTNLGLIVVDEEHEISLKQHDPEPRYHARDAALMRAKLANCLCILGSATPSIESMVLASEGKHIQIHMPERVQNLDMPNIQIVDMNQVEPTELGRVEVFSPQLLTAVSECIERREQVILMRNRRGYGTHVRCGKCHWVMECPNCSVSLTSHRDLDGMLCHLCGYFTDFPERCASCGSARIASRGFGTERVEEFLEVNHPDWRVLRMDADAVRERGAHQKLLTKFSNHEADILLGTRMVARGLDFPKVTLVGILAADGEWLLPDFRSEERALALLMQASGRSGRSAAGNVIVQTWEPNHPVLRYLVAHDWSGFSEYATTNRRSLGFPPFSRLIRILVSGPELAAVETEALRLREWLLSNQLTVSEAAPALIARREGWYRFALLIRFPRKASGREWLSKLPKPIFSDIRIGIDVDPVDFS